MIAALSLKKITRIFTVLIGILVLGFAAGSIFIQSQESKIQTAWVSFQADNGEKARLLSEFRARLGYGGMIHSFKNYVLRGNVRYLRSAQAHARALDVLLEKFSLIATSPGETAAIEDIGTVLTKYQESMAEAETLVALQKSPQAIDVTVRVDDSLAVRGLGIWEESLSHDITRTGSPITKSLALAQIRSALGYDGVIHHFKNYVLRLSNNAKEKAAKRILDARTAISGYRSLGTDGAERIALEDLDAVVNAYETGLTAIARKQIDGTSSAVIDTAVRVNDVPGFRALDLLEKAIHIHIRARADDMNETLSTVSFVNRMMSWGGIVGVVFLGTILIYFLRKRVREPIEALGSDMRALSEGDVDRFIVTEGFPDEVREMANAVLVFKKNTERMVKAEDALLTNSEKLEIQLAELQDLKERADAQASQAVSLAEGMAFAREEADKAKERAAADEQRIRAVVNAVTDAIVVIDAKGVIDSFNPAAEKMFGFGADEVIGRNVKLLMPDHHKEHHDGYLASYLEGQGADVGGKLREFDALRRDGTPFPIELSVRQMLIDGKVMFAGAIRDITERRRAEAQIRRMAMRDSLTGLANRNLFNQRLEEALSMSQREGWLVGLMMLDLDKFKPVNDTYGHPAGDALLQQAAVRMKKHSRETDTVARLGGDEFAIIVVNPDNRDGAIHPAQRIVEELTRPFNVLDHTVQIGTSIGIAFYPDDSDDAESLIQKADLALYAAKNAGRNTHRVYDPSMIKTSE